MKELLLIFSLVTSSSLMAAPIPLDKNLIEGTKPEILMALRLPMENRLLALAKNPANLAELRRVVFEKRMSLQMRWRALTAAARLDFNGSRNMLEKAMNSSDWFLRNAALVALVRGDRGMALDWSIKLLEDPALVVRTAAAHNLKELRDRRARQPLIAAFQSELNFKGGQSLWIRHHIARALAEMSLPGEEAFLIRMLEDKDERVHAWAVQGLERLTGKHMTASRDVNENRRLWVSWWSQQQGVSSRSETL